MHRHACRWLVAVALAAPLGADAHDTWLEASARIVRPGDVVFVDLVLGNHGNGHRDFKIAGKLSDLAGTTLEAVAPSGGTTDLVPALMDLGFAPTEGVWSGRLVPTEAGLHCVSLTRDGIRHGSRGRKGGKVFFVTSASLDHPPSPTRAHGRPLGHALELVPETHPVLGCGPGREIAVRLMLHGAPLAGGRVSFIPRGTVLAEGFDGAYERRTDAEGRCAWTPREGNVVLVVARHERSDEKGDGYDRTVYAATLVIAVPQRGP